MVAFEGSWSVVVEPDGIRMILPILLPQHFVTDAPIIAALIVADDDVLIGPGSGFAEPGGAGCADISVELNQAGGAVVELPIGGGFLHPAEVEFGVDQGLGIGEEKLAVVAGQGQGKFGFDLSDFGFNHGSLIYRNKNYRSGYLSNTISRIGTFVGRM
jgi:hypothetical protein